MQRSGVRPSVCPSVCPIDLRQQLRPIGLLLIACGQDISIDSCGRAAGAMLQAPALSSKCELLLLLCSV